MDREQGLRARKKQQTRQHISNVAMGLFVERGFDSVTVEEVARAADVSKMTVFNYFPRKEDLVVDRDEELLGRVRAAVQQAHPIRALRAVFLDLTSAGNPLMGAVPGAPSFWAFISTSPVLLARAASLTDALGQEIFAGLRRRRLDAASAHAVGGMVSGLWRATHQDGLEGVRQGQALRTVRARQLKILERGFAALEGAFPA